MIHDGANFPATTQSLKKTWTIGRRRQTKKMRGRVQVKAIETRLASRRTRSEWDKKIERHIRGKSRETDRTGSFAYQSLSRVV